ncbi:ABC transporter ATP-binding protein [Corynebacterium uropygiale]|uniref:ABC transporter ATP-binding protein n=1 Tax=Corynebacterium uropygiale TaxID=1775911 RepID=A0A9X1QN56_9CORY|nr:ABC transporter ATP-binding protein [Corynebacterium uropygiale]
MTLDHRLVAEHLELSYGNRPIAEDLNIEIPAGKVTSIIGPNGCGKSTLLRSLSRLLTPQRGAVVLDDRSLQQWGRRDLAKVLGLLPQSPIAPEGLIVADLVGRGRHPHQGFLGQWSAHDYEVVEAALRDTGICDLADSPVDELSGGQRQRVWIAMALAQDTDILLLDEPTTFLDIAHQLDILELVTQLNRTRGTTVVMVLHDMNLAAKYSDSLIAMRDGSILAQGTPQEVITPASINQVFGVEASVLEDPASGTPLVVPHRTRKDAS